MRQGKKVARILIVLGAVLAVFASSASAKGGGQIESWGAAGTGNGQFLNPGLLGVDSTSGTVYGGDISSDKTNFRVQQLSPTGEFKASVTIPRKIGTEIFATLHGIAVDPSLERFYVIEGCKVASGLLNCKQTGQIFGARKILAYSTTPSAGALVPAATTPTIALPAGEKELYKPMALAVDPANHDLVVLAEDANHHTVVQRFSSAGVEGARFTDTANKLRPSAAASPAAGKDATSIAVSPSGVTYALTGNPNASGATRAWQLPATLSTVEAVPGFAEAAEKENWTAAMTSSPEDLIGGQQLAISSDGATLYWKEKVSGSEPTEAGNILVRGFSLAGKETTALWGSGTTTCKITTTNSGIAAGPSGKLVVFDYGPATEPPPYGVKVLTFGASGSGCLEPKAKFTVNGKSESEVPTGIEPGATVSFDAASSELFGGFRRELIWKFGDGSEKVVKFTPGIEGEEDKQAITTATHVYSTAAKVTVRLEIKLSAAVLGNPDPVERSFIVGTVPSGLKLTVSKSGTGGGTVTSSPAGISCGASCETEFETGQEVELTQAASSGSKFVKWTGACSGSGSCKVTISAAKSVGAEFALIPKFKLTVAKAGTGAGTVTSVPAGINCGSGCEAEFEEGKEVTLTAAPAAGSQLAGWSGGGCLGTGSCTVTINAAKSVTATFALEQHQLTVAKSGNGTGTVGSSPSGISCGATCSASFNHGVVVTLTPTPGSGSEFKGWAGACSGSGSCEVTIDAAKSVSAEFALEQHLLTASKSGTGSGTVTSSPSGISCGATCSAGFNHGVEVTLTPAAGGGSEFKGWTGACTGTGACKVTMSAAKSVGAEFALIPGQKLLKVLRAGTGTGSVTSSPAGINCGATCESGFVEGTVVTLVATAGANSKAALWSGCDSIVGSNECKVTMSAGKEVTATFALEQHLLTVTASGTGTVTSSPSGISCGATCSASFNHGIEVTLTPVAGSGFEFNGWTGACAGTGACKVTITAAREVGAAFGAIPTTTPTETPVVPPISPAPPAPSPPSSSGGSGSAQTLAKALKKCKKVKGKARAKCIKKAKTKARASAARQAFESLRFRWRL